MNAPLVIQRSITSNAVGQNVSGSSSSAVDGSPVTSVQSGSVNEAEIVERLLAAERAVVQAEAVVDLLEGRLALVTAALVALRSKAREAGIPLPSLAKTRVPADAPSEHFPDSDTFEKEPSTGGQKAPTTLTVVEAAKLLNIDRNTLYSALKRGDGPPVRRLGRAFRIDRDALLEWFRAGDTAPLRRRGRR